MTSSLLSTKSLCGKHQGAKQSLLLLSVPFACFVFSPARVDGDHHLMI